jgi:DNA modification methylase
MDRRHVGAARIIRGNALALPLADDSVDLVVTSPPYFGLRSYQDAGEHYDGQIGAEATPAEFVDALIAATREMVRVLKPSGSIWVNLGDKYVADNRGTGFDAKRGAAKHAPRGPLGFITGGMRQKSLMGVPWRYALRCIDDLGLILRAEVIWSKPNGLPRYYSAVDEIREAHSPSTIDRYSYALAASGPSRGAGANVTDRSAGHEANPLGKLPGSVWSIPTQPLKVPAELGIDHFAAFPMEWPRRIIQGWSPAGVCVECGEGRRPVTHKKPMEWRPSPTIAGRQAPDTARQVMSGTMLSAAETTITGYSCGCAPHLPSKDESDKCANGHHDLCTWGCGCDHHANMAPTRPAVVLDPFGGTGTTALVAKALGRDGISVDMSADYCRLAQWRTNDPGELANAMRVDKPLKQIDGQVSMFDLLDFEGGAA